MTGSPLVDDTANYAAYEALVRALREGGAIALVGAGSSARVGYPLWGGLLARLEAEVRRLRPHAEGELKGLASESDTLWRAERYRALLGPDGYEPLMREIFGPRQPPFDGFHQDLLRLPFRHVLTTNYDPVLEHAHVAAFQEPPTGVAWSCRPSPSSLRQEKRVSGSSSNSCTRCSSLMRTRRGFPTRRTLASESTRTGWMASRRVAFQRSMAPSVSRSGSVQRGWMTKR